MTDISGYTVCLECGNKFLGRAYVVIPVTTNPEGNTLTVTEFIRLLEVSGSVTAKQSSETRENT